MSYSGGWSTTNNGAPSFNFGEAIQQGMQGLNTIGGTVGAGEKPEYDFPMGLDRVPEAVRSWFMRSDNGPTGLNEFLRNAKPEDISAFRAAVNGGLIRPKNAAADQIIKGYGGLRAGDMAGPGGILGPMQDDMPSGLSPEYWAQANTLIGTMIDAQMKAAEQSGYFNGLPTVQREQIMGQLAQGWKQQFTNEFLANEQKRASMAQEGLSQQEINNQNLQSMAKIMGGTVGADGKFQQTEEGRQFDTSQTGWMNGQRTLAGQAQDWSQQKDVAQAASNPRDYIYAQMLGNARGGLAGQPATNQLQMPNNQPPGPGGQQGWNPANWNASTGQMGPGAGQAGMNPLASTQAPGTSGAGTMAQNGTPGAAEGLPSGTNEWAAMMQQAQGAQDQARQAMLGAQGGPGAGAASALSPGPGSAGMVQPWGGYGGMQGAAGQATDKPLPDMTQMQSMLAQQGQWNPQLPQGVQAIPEGGGQPDGMAHTMDMPSGVTQEYRQLMQTNPEAARQQRMQEIQRMQQGGFRAPGAMPGQAPGAGAMPQQQQQPGGQQFTTSAFSQALLKNRLVPQTGALQNQGAYMTGQQVQKALPNMNKVRAQDYMRGNQSERQGFNAVASQSGFSDEDTMSGIKNNLTQFKAPSAGRMI